MMLSYLFSFFFCKSLGYKKIEQNLLSKAIKMIKNDTDIATVISKLHDIDKLKSLLLSED